MVVPSSLPAERRLKGREKITGQERAGPPVVGLGQFFLLQHQHSHLRASGNSALAYSCAALACTGAAALGASLGGQALILLGDKCLWII